MSLRSIIRKGRFHNNWADTDQGRKEFDHVVAYTLQGLKDHRTILVNAQSVLDDMLPDLLLNRKEAWTKALRFSEVPKANPPYAHMWIEAMVKSKTDLYRTGALVARFDTHGDAAWLLDASIAATSVVSAENGRYVDEIREQLVNDKPETFINTAVFQEYQGGAVYTGGICYWLDAEGNFLSSVRQFAQLPDDEIKRIKQETNLRVWQAWIMQSFARMNCNNVELRPINEGKFQPHAPNKIVPASVWHEIVVTSVPKIRSTGSDIFEKDEREIRAHWIRGHYADYRKGRGLFGNPKLRCLFWIPEHRSGNEELGQVIPEYTIQ